MREIDRDLEEEEMTILELSHFWQDFVAANVEPPYTESGDLVLESIRRYQGKADPSLPQITLSSADTLRLEQCLKLREEKQALDKRGRELEKEIKGVYAPHCGSDGPGLRRHLHRWENRVPGDLQAHQQDQYQEGRAGTAAA